MEVNLEETFHMYLNCLTQFFKQETVIHLKKVYNNFFWCHFNLIKNNHLINGVLCNGHISRTVRKSVNAYNIYIIYIYKIYVIYMIYIYIIIKICNHENNLLFWLLPHDVRLHIAGTNEPRVLNKQNEEHNISGHKWSPMHRLLKLCQKKMVVMYI